MSVCENYENNSEKKVGRYAESLTQIVFEKMPQIERKYF